MKSALRLLRSSPLLCLLGLLGCQHAAPAPKAAEAEPRFRARDFYPLKVGNQWTYAIRANGRETQRTVQIVREEAGFFVDTMNARLRQDDTGLRDEHRYLIENPVETGRKWFAVLSMKSTEHFEITDVGHPCSVKAGTFGNCLVVQATDEVNPGQTLVIESTYAQGVGLVAVRTSQEQGGNAPVPQVELELVSYQLAQ